MADIILGIHSNVAGDDESFTAGHAWLSITQSGVTTTYGLWPDSHPSRRVIDNGDKSDIRVGLELNSQAIASRYYKLTGPQAVQFNKIIGANVHWQYTHNCSSFATDTVYAILKADVDADDYFGLETPRELGRNILLLEAKSRTSIISPRILKNNPASSSSSFSK